MVVKLRTDNGPTIDGKWCFRFASSGPALALVVAVGGGAVARGDG